MTADFTLALPHDPVLTLQAMRRLLPKPGRTARALRSATALLISAALWTIISALTGYRTDGGDIIGFLAGAGLALCLWQFPRMRQIRFFRAEADRLHKIAAPASATVSPKGLPLHALLGQSDLTWLAIGAIAPLPNGTALRVNTGSLAIPDRSLPTDLTPDSLPTTLRHWQDTAP